MCRHRCQFHVQACKSAAVVECDGSPRAIQAEHGHLAELHPTMLVSLWACLPFSDLIEVAQFSLGSTDGQKQNLTMHPAEAVQSIHYL